MAQVKEGKVVSVKMNKTVVVEIKLRKKHPLYRKILIRSKRIKVHNDQEVRVGQLVKIEETRPYSKEVHFKILEVIK